MCDNIQEAHDNIVINETSDAIRTYCKICGEVNVLRKDKLSGRMDNIEYSRIFKRDVLQPSENLYYKYHPELMSLI
jgi:hypothetical protein